MKLKLSISDFLCNVKVIIQFSYKWIPNLERKKSVDSKRWKCYLPVSTNERSNDMASDELRIILEDVKEKFDLVIEAVNMTNERLNRHEKVVEERFDKLDTEIFIVKKDMRGMQGEISGIKGEISGINGEISGIKGEIKGIKGDISGIKGDIDGIKGEINGIKGHISGIKGEIHEMRGDIRDLQQDLNDHRSNTELHGSRSSKKVS